MHKSNLLNTHIKEWLHLIQEEQKPFFPFKSAKLQEPLARISSQKLVKKERMLSQAKKPKEEEKSDFEEILPSQEFIEDSEMRTIFEKEVSSLSYKPLYAPLVILHAPLNENEMQFLKKFEKALTNHLITAQLLPFDSSLLKEPHISLLLCPARLMKEKVAPHTLLHGKPTILPLASFSEYINDIQLKRHLWQILNSPPLRNLLRLS